MHKEDLGGSQAGQGAQLAPKPNLPDVQAPHEVAGGLESAVLAPIDTPALLPAPACGTRLRAEWLGHYEGPRTLIIKLPNDLAATD